MPLRLNAFFPLQMHRFGVLRASSQQCHARVPKRTKVRFSLPSKGCMASDTLQLLKVHIVLFFLFLFLSLWFSRKLHSIEISSNFCFVCVKGLSIACESRESTTVRWENSSGMRKRLCLSDFSFLGTKIDNFKFIRD